jgi:hypothetical protein
MTDVLLTAEQWASMMRAPLKDQSYQLTGLGPAVADFLAWKKLDGAADRTLDQYERDLSRACVLFPEKSLETLSSEDILHWLLLFPPRSQKRARAAMASMFKWSILWDRVERNPMDRIPRAPQSPGPLRGGIHGRRGLLVDEHPRHARSRSDGSPFRHGDQEG